MIYLDHNATTPVDPGVLAEMLPWFSERPGNAASVSHLPGSDAAAAVAAARAELSKLIGCETDEIVFTSGATEAVNIAVAGTLARADSSAEIVVSAVEHPAVSESAALWGDRLRVAPVDGSGVVDTASIERLMSPDTALVCVMAANNETGALQPTAAIGQLCAERGVPLLVDATQMIGRLPARDALAYASMVAVSAHKMRGPKGVGALVVRRRRPRPRLSPLHFGGGQERGLRPGTLNVPGIVGLGAAAQLAYRVIRSDPAGQRVVGDRLLEGLQTAVHGLQVNGPSFDARLPQTLSLLMPGVDAHALVRLVSHDVALSVGSACTTTDVDPSHVLLAMGRTAQQAGQSIRLSWGPDTSLEDADRAVSTLRDAVGRLHAIAGVA